MEACIAACQATEHSSWHLFPFAVSCLMAVNEGEDDEEESSFSTGEEMDPQLFH